MAEFIMKRLVRNAGLEADYDIASAATSAEEIGNPVYPMARQELAKHGIGCPGKTARRMTAADYTDYDLLIAMDDNNRRAMRVIAGGDPKHKIHRLLDFTDAPRDIADPWYTRNFSAAWDDIYAGCEALFNHLEQQ